MKSDIFISFLLLQVIFERTHAHILFFLTCQCPSGQSHRFSGVCTGEYTAKIYHSRETSHKPERLCLNAKQGANAETFSAVGKLLDHQHSVLVVRHFWKSALRAPIPLWLHAAFPLHSQQRCWKSERPDICIIGQKHPQSPKRKTTAFTALCFARKRCRSTVPGTTRALSRVASVELGSQADGYAR